MLLPKVSADKHAGYIEKYIEQKNVLQVTHPELLFAVNNQGLIFPCQIYVKPSPHLEEGYTACSLPYEYICRIRLSSMINTIKSAHQFMVINEYGTIYEITPGRVLYSHNQLILPRLAWYVQAQAWFLSEEATEHLQDVSEDEERGSCFREIVRNRSEGLR